VEARSCAWLLLLANKRSLTMPQLRPAFVSTRAFTSGWSSAGRVGRRLRLAGCPLRAPTGVAAHWNPSAILGQPRRLAGVAAQDCGTGLGDRQCAVDAGDRCRPRWTGAPQLDRTSLQTCADLGVEDRMTPSQGVCAVRVSSGRREGQYVLVASRPLDRERNCGHPPAVPVRLNS
jgi:hypothetical protein